MLPGLLDCCGVGPVEGQRRKSVPQPAGLPNGTGREFATLTAGSPVASRQHIPPYRPEKIITPWSQNRLRYKTGGNPSPSLHSMTPGQTSRQSSSLCPRHVQVKRNMYNHTIGRLSSQRHHDAASTARTSGRHPKGTGRTACPQRTTSGPPTLSLVNPGSVISRGSRMRSASSADNRPISTTTSLTRFPSASALFTTSAALS